MIAEILTTALCAYLWGKGGDKNGKIRDIPVPIILALFIAIATKTWWMFFAVSAGLQAIRFGYGNYDPEHDDKPSHLASLLKDRQGKYIRATWGFIVSVCAGLFPFAFGFISIWDYKIYIILNLIINFCVSHFNMKRLPTDILVAVGISSLIFLV